MRAALIRDDVAENVIEASEDYEAPDGYELEFLADDQFVGPGWLRIDGQWSAPGVDAPAEPAPDPVQQIRDDLDWLINFVVTGEG